MRMLRNWFMLSAIFLSFSASASDFRLLGPDGEGFGLVFYNSVEGIEVNASVFPKTFDGEELTSYVVKFVSVDVSGIAMDLQYDAETGELVGLNPDNSVRQIEGPLRDEILDLIRPALALRGYIEKFDVGGDTEQMRLVFRDSRGRFLTWHAIDSYVKKGWNLRSGQWVYEVRYGTGLGDLSGLIINAAYLRAQINNLGSDVFIHYPNRPCPALAIRDTADGIHNGKFLTLVEGTVRNEIQGPIECRYYPGVSPFLEPSQFDFPMLVYKPTASD